jgi:hypothetical protein
VGVGKLGYLDPVKSFIDRTILVRSARVLAGSGDASSADSISANEEVGERTDMEY